VPHSECKDDMHGMTNHELAIFLRNRKIRLGYDLYIDTDPDCPKDQGGLGILNLQLQNKCLLAKWLVNLLNTEGT
jgi:hypothetical protein